MTYGELKQRALGLIFTESITGNPIEATYNCQADYLRQIPGLLESAQTYVWQWKKVITVVMLSDLQKMPMGDVFDMYYLPDDCLQLVSIINPHTEKRRKFLSDRFTDYRVIENGKKVLVPVNVDDDMIVEYYKRPTSIGDNPPDSLLLEGTDEMVAVYPFYVAYNLCRYDDMGLSDRIKNEFEDRLTRLAVDPVFIEQSDIIDVYS